MPPRKTKNLDDDDDYVIDDDDGGDDGDDNGDDRDNVIVEWRFSHECYPITIHEKKTKKTHFDSEFVYKFCFRIYLKIQPYIF